MSADPQLPGVLADLAPVLDHYGYLAVGGFVLLEDFGVPLPGETILLAAALYAGAGRLDVVLVGVIALVAAVLGDNVGWLIGRFGGRRLVLRFGRYVLLTPARLDSAERWFSRHGSRVVVVARFVDGLRQANGIIAGLTRMPWRRFLVFNTVGAALWVGLWTTVGVLAGDHVQAVYGVVSKVFLYLLGALVLFVAVRVVVAVRKHRRQQRRGGDRDGEQGVQHDDEQGDQHDDHQPLPQPGGASAAR